LDEAEHFQHPKFLTGQLGHDADRGAIGESYDTDPGSARYTEPAAVEPEQLEPVTELPLQVVLDRPGRRLGRHGFGAVFLKPHG
jgi:hypothetical protein